MEQRQTSAPAVVAPPALLGRAASGAAPLLPGLVVGVLATLDGGFFPGAWGPAILVLAAFAALALLLRERLELSRLELVALGAIGLLTAWVACSRLWSADPAATLLESQRTLVYPVGFAAALLLARRASVAGLLLGLAAVTAAVPLWSLGARLLHTEPLRPDRFQELALFRPIGYANALGLLAAIGVLLGLAFSLRAENRPLRAAAAACVALLPSALLLTESRGAALALGAGLVVFVLLEVDRSRLLRTSALLALPAGLGVWLTARADALTDPAGPLQVSMGEGRRLAVALLVLAVCAAVLVEVLPRLRRPRGAALAGAAVVAVVLAGSVAVGGPDLPELPSLGEGVAGSNRGDYWRVAWRQWLDEPVLGAGAGTFAGSWLEHRPIDADARDAHNLYLESLAELGPVGLALLLAALATPLVAALRARRHPFVPGAAAAYVAYLVHAALDWDWELPAVTLTALVCGAALLVAARREPAPLGIRVRGLLLVLLLGVAAAGALTLLSHGRP